MRIGGPPDGVGREAINFSPKKKNLLRNVRQGLGLGKGSSEGREIDTGFGTWAHEIYGVSVGQAQRLELQAN
jgi:hypothetical protein